ncbi:MAG: thioredoxin [Eubacterium sp.]|nr:thioredoxin [Eubacterium sp.]MBR1532168.1 thioredoxin [Eubacterium sp.]MBR2278618.1 thioredoxin [Eubacterium sp.]
MVKEITEANFEAEVLNSGKTCLIDFYAVWCGPCKIMSPVVDEIAEENADIVVGKIDVDENEELAEKYGVMSIPTILVIKNGEVAETFIGVTPKENILAAIG